METILLHMTQETHKLRLPKKLYVKSFVCGVFELKCTIEPHQNLGDLFLCSNFTREIIVDDICLPVLREINWHSNTSTNRAVCNEKFSKILWHSLERDEMEEIQLYISNKHGQIPSFQSLQLSCLLVFIPQIDLI